MFTSPCSLRSTQCATLIALAAAAGLVRVETSNTAGVARPGAATDPAAESLERNPPSTRAAQSWGALISINFKSFDLSTAVWAQGTSPSTESIRVDTAASDLLRLAGLIQLAVQMNDVADSCVLPISSLLSGHRPVYFGSPSPARSSRQHVFPFAVGPPDEDAISNPHADDTSVSGDLAVCGMLLVQVAYSKKLSLIAQPTRDRNRATKLAWPFSKPSFALRGELVPLDRNFTGPLRAFRCPRPDARINSYPV